MKKKNVISSLIMIGTFMGCGGFAGKTYDANDDVSEVIGQQFQVQFGLGGENDDIDCKLTDKGDTKIVSLVEKKRDADATAEENSKGKMFFVFEGLKEGQTKIKIECVNGSIGAPAPLDTIVSEIDVTIIPEKFLNNEEEPQ